MPPAVRMQPLAGDGFGRDADDHPVGDAGHHVGVAGLADAGDAPVLDADVGFAHAGPVDDERVGDDAVERALVGDAGGLAHAVAEHLAAAELALVAIDRRVLLDSRDETGVAELNAIAGGRAVDVGVVTAADDVAHAGSMRVAETEMRAGRGADARASARSTPDRRRARCRRE